MSSSSRGTLGSLLSIRALPDPLGKQALGGLGLPLRRKASFGPQYPDSTPRIGVLVSEWGLVQANVRDSLVSSLTCRSRLLRANRALHAGPTRDMLVTGVASPALHFASSSRPYLRMRALSSHLPGSGMYLRAILSGRSRLRLSPMHSPRGGRG